MLWPGADLVSVDMVEVEHVQKPPGPGGSADSLTRIGARDGDG